MFYNVKDPVEAKAPMNIMYIITFDGYTLPILPAAIQRSLRGREEHSYQQGVGGFIQRVYIPGLEELQLDIYLPKFVPITASSQHSSGNEMSYSDSTYSNVNNPDAGEFFNNIWLEMTKDPTIVGQNALIEKMMTSIKIAKPIHVVIERIQGVSGNTFGAGSRLLTDGLYVASAVDVRESAESSMWCIMSLSMTEYRFPEDQYVANNAVNSEIDAMLDRDLPVPLDMLVITNGMDPAIKNVMNVMVGGSPRQFMINAGFRGLSKAASFGMSKIPKMPRPSFLP
jgi:hypothetical protein